MIGSVGVPPAVAATLVSLVASYVAWVGHRVSRWVDDQRRRTAANEVRSHVHRRVLADELEADVDTLPPADDPAEERLGAVRTDGGESRGR